jgi:colanic acid biosynthesis protein WcaH
MLSPEAFDSIVRLTPLVSFDLLVRDPRRRLLLGRRTNRPAKDTWFVPGGRIHKDERLAAAFRRITRAELGVEVALAATRFVGYFEHFYPDNRSGAPGFGTHYIVLAQEFARETPLDALPDDQHAAYRWMSDAEALAHPEVHENTKAYCRLTGR